MWRAVMAAWSFAGALLAAQSVEGRVVNAVTGAAIPAASIIIRTLAENPEGLHRATSDAEGRFRIEGLEPGTYSVFCKAHGYWTDPAQQDSDRQRKFQVKAGNDASPPGTETPAASEDRRNGDRCARQTGPQRHRMGPRG